MQTQSLSFFTLLLMISFASVNAVLFTPALPDIARFFAISADKAEWLITWFLIGYALGQLIYGPLANRFGRKPALYMGIGTALLSSLLCVLSGILHQYYLLIFARFMLALGSGVGLKMTFTIVNEYYRPEVASQKMSYLMLAFAITPGLAVALGGFLTTYWDWMSCFYAGAIYALILLFLVMGLPETGSKNKEALQVKHLIHGYSAQFKNTVLISGGLLMGSCTTFVYAFAAIAPFLAMNILNMTSAQYGVANLLLPIGLIAGSLVSAKLVERYTLTRLIKIGMMITIIGVILMLMTSYLHLPPLFSLFLPMIVIYFGSCFILANASTVAMSHVFDKSHGSAVMSFINMGLTTLVVLALGLFQIQTLLLPSMFILITLFMLIIYQFGIGKTNRAS